MDSKKFFSEIRSIIREEVEYAMKKYVDNQQLTERVVEKKQNVRPMPRPQPVSKNTGTTALQQIMEETRLAMTNSLEVGMEDMGLNESYRMPKTQEPNFNNGITENSLINVDYSKMLKKMEEKAKANRPV
jgi:hypothetical protein